MLLTLFPKISILKPIKLFHAKARDGAHQNLD